MCGHVEKIQKFVQIRELSNMQVQIALSVLENQEFDNEGNQKGVTGYRIRDKGISGASLDRHKEELLKGRVLYVVSTKKTGTQVKVFYGLTPFGYFLLLKKNRMKALTRRYAQIFLPSIFDLWKELEKYPSSKAWSFINTLNNITPYPIGTSEKIPTFRINIPTKDHSTYISQGFTIDNTLKDSLFGWFILSNLESLFFIDLFFKFDFTSPISKIIETVKLSGFSKETEKYLRLGNTMLREYKEIRKDRKKIFENDPILKKNIIRTIELTNEIVKNSLLDVPFKD